MVDIIKLLPDSVANQIAAGEVVQRPASVVKELVENSVDAGSTDIKVNIKDAGRTLIQVIDNGKGMSETDARLAFERHSTSKINDAKDLFAIQTMGFRGEALASISAVAQVELKTKREEDEIGTQITIDGSKFIEQKQVSAITGCNFQVKNLFFNIPARRKFLKSNTTEFNHIVSEFQRVALAHPQIAFALIHNGTEIFNLSISNFRQRIVGLFGKRINENLITVESNTSIVKIKGFIGKPEKAKKKHGEQYFFINGRFMKNPYFHRAVMDAYNQILQPETIPSYFIYFEAPVESIDVNIHPTKTEIKFEEYQGIWQILLAAVKQALGKNNIVPSIDFDVEAGFDIPVIRKETDIKQPEIKIDETFNPFKEETKPQFQRSQPSNINKENLGNWEKLYQGFEKEDSAIEPGVSIDSEQKEIAQIPTSAARFFQLKNRYILTPVKSGLMIIDQKRAHERILFERYAHSLSNNTKESQKSLFPVNIELSPVEHKILMDIKDDIYSLGFDISDFGGNTIVINGLPAELEGKEPEKIIDDLLIEYQNDDISFEAKSKERLALSLAKASSISYNQALTIEEMREIFDRLFACSNPNYSPSGKKIMFILQSDELEKRFN